jgi:hypothetical protein
MTDIAPADWDALAALARQVGLPDERVAALRRRLDSPAARPGGPVTLLAGRPDAGLELLLARWLGPAAADALAAAGDRPLVVGPDPKAARLPGDWPTFQHAGGPGHLVVVRSAGKPAAGLLARLGALGHADALVLVSRLNQPLHQAERELLAGLAGVAATARVLVVAVPGEEPTASDVAEVAAYAAGQLRAAGFAAGRSGGAAVWFTDGVTRGNTLADPTPFLTVPPAAAEATAGMRRQAVGGLLAELKALAAAAPPPTGVAVSEAEQDRLARELSGFLADLGRDLSRRADGRRPVTADDLRRQAIDAVRGWGGYIGVEGHWLKYVEKLRPGTQAALLAEATAAVTDLDLSTTRPADPPPAGLDPTTRLAVRAGGGLAAGVGGYVLTSHLLTRVAAVALPEFLVTAMSGVGLAAAAVVAFRLLGKLLPPGPAAALAEPDAPTVLGWPQVAGRLTAWFRHHLGTRPASPAAACDALTARLTPAEDRP